MLVKLGRMGHICLGCLAQVASTMLPAMTPLWQEPRPVKPDRQNTGGNVVDMADYLASGNAAPREPPDSQ